MAVTVLPNGFISSPSHGRCCSRINEVSLLVAWHQLVLRPLPTATLIGYQSETQWASKADRPVMILRSASNGYDWIDGFEPG
jgi:hypothetical protein